MSLFSWFSYKLSGAKTKIKDGVVPLDGAPVPVSYDTADALGHVLDSVVYDIGELQKIEEFLKARRDALANIDRALEAGKAQNLLELRKEFLPVYNEFTEHKKWIDITIKAAEVRMYQLDQAIIKYADDDDKRSLNERLRAEGLHSEVRNSGKNEPVVNQLKQIRSRLATRLTHVQAMSRECHEKSEIASAILLS